MARVALALLVALSMGACAPSEDPTEPSAETVAALETLGKRIDALEADLADDADDSEAAENRVDRRLGSLAAKLDRSLERLRESLQGARGGASEAEAEAASALAAARAVASQLEVLEQRYDYHLRRYHGGGG